MGGAGVIGLVGCKLETGSGKFGIIADILRAYHEPDAALRNLHLGFLKNFISTIILCCKGYIYSEFMVDKIEKRLSNLSKCTGLVSDQSHSPNPGGLTQGRSV